MYRTRTSPGVSTVGGVFRRGLHEQPGGGSTVETGATHLRQNMGTSPATHHNTPNTFATKHGYPHPQHTMAWRKAAGAHRAMPHPSPPAISAIGARRTLHSRSYHLRSRTAASPFLFAFPSNKKLFPCCSFPFWGDASAPQVSPRFHFSSGPFPPYFVRTCVATTWTCTWELAFGLPR